MDGIRAAEADRDCGFDACGQPCAVGMSCFSSRDCSEGVCDVHSLTCLAAQCDDGVENGDETCLDAGGPTCLARCPLDAACNSNSDCASNRCEAGSCMLALVEEDTDADDSRGSSAFNTDSLIAVATTGGLNSLGIESLSVVPPPPPPPPSCSDGIKNGNESATDCGAACGDNNLRCGNGIACNDHADCLSQRCYLGSCAVPTCSDGIMNGAEACRDGGGPDCVRRCNLMDPCLVDADCQSKVCSTVTQQCISAGCASGARDGNETGLDCGGPDCEPCPAHGGCQSHEDCVSNVCNKTSSLCSAANCFDGVKNGLEVDVDCSGECPQLCGLGKTCTSSADCVNSTTCALGHCISISYMADLNDTRASSSAVAEAGTGGTSLGSKLGKGIFTFLPPASYSALIDNPHALPLNAFNKNTGRAEALVFEPAPTMHNNVTHDLVWHNVSVYRKEGTFGSVSVVVAPAEDDTIITNLSTLGPPLPEGTWSNDTHCDASLPLITHINATDNSTYTSRLQAATLRAYAPANARLRHSYPCCTTAVFSSWSACGLCLRCC